MSNPREQGPSVEAMENLSREELIAQLADAQARADAVQSANHGINQITGLDQVTSQQSEAIEQAQEERTSRERRLPKLRTVAGAIGVLAATAALSLGLTTSGTTGAERAATTGASPAAGTTDPRPTMGPAAPGSKVPARYKAVKGTTTVSQAMNKLETSGPTQAASDVLNHRPQFKKEVSHNDNKVSELQANPETISTNDAFEALFISINSDPQNSMITMNGMQKKDSDAPRTDAHSERLPEIAKAFTDKDTKFGRKKVSGYFYNTSVNEQTGEVSEQVQYFKDLDVLTVTLENGTEIMYKIGGGSDQSGKPCLNRVRTAPKPVPTTARTVTTSVVPRHFVSTPPETTPPVTTPPEEEHPPVCVPGEDEECTPPPPPPPECVPGKDEECTPPEVEEGKDHTKSPVTSDRNNPDQDRRPNIEPPAVAIQPVDAPAVDPYEAAAPVPSPTRPDVIPAAEDPRGPAPADQTPDPTPVSEETVPEATVVTGP